MRQQYLGSDCDYDNLWTENKNSILNKLMHEELISFGLRLEKSGSQGFRPGLTQTSLYSHRKELES